MAYRSDIITRGHETNNYAEATVRLLKDIMLDRRKAYNVVALVGYIVDVLEPYYENRLYEVASGRPSPLLVAFAKLQSTANTLSLSGAVQLESDTYQVPSSFGETSYVVNVREGICTCPKGESGALCKHQLALSTSKELALPNLPAVTYKERRELACLALGSRAPAETFFMTDVELLGGTVTESGQSFRAETCFTSTADTDVLEEAVPCADAVTSEQIDEVRSALASELSRLPSLLSESPSATTLGVLHKFTAFLSGIETEEQLTAFAVSKSSSRLGCKIPVQPTSTARRRPGLSHTTSRVPAGRPVGVIKRRVKIKRSLRQSICHNRPNAKSHGVGH